MVHIFFKKKTFCLFLRIAGWNHEKDEHLQNIIHFGDELVQIGNVPIKGMEQIPNLFYTQATPGTPVNFLKNI